MYKFGTKSKEKLEQCHPKLQLICNQLIKVYDVSVITGHRSIEEQQEKFKQGLSKLDGIKKKSKHNYKVSLAVDLCPYPVDWNDRERFFYMAGLFMGIANRNGIYNIRWGGCWRCDNNFKANKFDDLPHFELVGEV